MGEDLCVGEVGLEQVSSRVVRSKELPAVDSSFAPRIPFRLALVELFADLTETAPSSRSFPFLSAESTDLLSPTHL